MGDVCCGPADIEKADGDESGVEWRTVAAGVAAVSWVAGVIAEIAGIQALATAAFVVAVVAGGSTFAPGALLGLRRGRLGVGLLMTIAAIGALLLGQLAEAAALCFLFSVSEALEDWAVTRARRGLRALLSLVPPTTVVRRGDDLVEIETDELAVGDLVVLRAGARMPTDGVVRAGRSVLDVSAVTGESIPVDAAPGDRVLAGSINTTGTLDVEATVATADSTLARIVHAVEEAQDRKGHAQRLADRIARPLVPSILVIAAAIAVIGALARRSGRVGRTGTRGAGRRVAVRVRDRRSGHRVRIGRCRHPRRVRHQGRRCHRGTRHRSSDRIRQDRHPHPQPTPSGRHRLRRRQHRRRGPHAGGVT